jgi:hypothetical protein
MSQKVIVMNSVPDVAVWEAGSLHGWRCLAGIGDTTIPGAV